MTVRAFSMVRKVRIAFSMALRSSPGSIRFASCSSTSLVRMAGL